MKKDSACDSAGHSAGFCAKYVETEKGHKWIMNPVYFNGEPILNIKPVKGLCRHRNVLVCPLYRKNGGEG